MCQQCILPQGQHAWLQVIDEGVDSLTTGALHSLGTLFARVGQAAGAAAKELRDTVEGGVMDIGSLPVVQAASTGIAAAPRTAGGLMQRLGQSVAALEGAMASSRLDDAPSTAPLPFEEAFKVYGGTQCLEELESLSNECARTVNRTRAQLAADTAASGRLQALEDLSAALPAVFDLQTVRVFVEYMLNSQCSVIPYSHMCRTPQAHQPMTCWLLATAS